MSRCPNRRQIHRCSYFSTLGVRCENYTLICRKRTFKRSVFVETSRGCTSVICTWHLTLLSRPDSVVQIPNACLDVPLSADQGLGKHAGPCCDIGLGRHLKSPQAFQFDILPVDPCPETAPPVVLGAMGGGWSAICINWSSPPLVVAKRQNRRIAFSLSGCLSLSLTP